MNTFARGARAVGRGLRETLLTVAAIGGVICIVLVILAFTGGFSLIMFKTGSMSPTIPAGSVALVQRMPASEVVVGDIVTVDRPGALPITHRVTGIARDSGNERVITMKGDANDSVDPAPYAVSQVRIVRGSLPHLANVIVWFGNPLVLGGITIAASLLVVWAFWPRARSTEPPADESVGSDDPDAGSESGGELARSAETGEPHRALVSSGGALRRDRRS